MAALEVETATAEQRDTLESLSDADRAELLSWKCYDQWRAAALAQLAAEDEVSETLLAAAAYHGWLTKMGALIEQDR